MNDDSKGWRRWLPQWAPTLAALAALLAAVVTATFYLGGEIASVKADVAGVKDGLARVESRIDTMETRMVALFADQLRDNRRDVADARERISALEARAD